MRVAVIGFGMMGRQIAQVFAQHGNEVAVTDENPVAVKSGLDEVAHGLYGVESAGAEVETAPGGGAKNSQKIRPAADARDPCHHAHLLTAAEYENPPPQNDLFPAIEYIAPH